ncbi:hypothetical protein ACF082_33955 [Streptomyces lydicus]|uniref:hypothetical protein n=1 Tax=Streptomyces lydicus TaxID=47763 RepID=UPI0036F6F79F
MSTITSGAAVPVSAQDDRAGRATWMYKMRSIVTATEREVAAALVQDRDLWLTRRGHDAPALHVTAFRDHHTEPVGLYEADGGDEVLVGCLLLHRQPDLRTWGVDDPPPAVKASLAHTASPGLNAMIHCTVPLQSADTRGERGEGTAR